MAKLVCAVCVKCGARTAYHKTKKAYVHLNAVSDRAGVQSCDLRPTVRMVTLIEEF